MHTWHVLRIRTVSNADGLYRAYDPSTAGSATVRQYWTWLYSLKAKIYIYKEVPDLTLLVNREAKKFRLAKTKFLSHRHEISSYITNFRFDSSPRLRSIRRHLRTINEPKFHPFFVWNEGLHFFGQNLRISQLLEKVRLTPRICTALSLRILRSRRLEVVGKRKNVRARSRHARGEGAPARKAPENRFPPLSNYLAAVAWSVKSFDRKRLTSHKQSVPPKSVVHFIFGLNISVIKISWVLWL